MRVIIRIRGPEERKLRADARPNRVLAALGSAAVAPLALVCFLLCGWRWMMDLGLIGRFVVGEGFWSHWQVWFAGGVLFQGLAAGLGRYAGSDAVAGAELLRKELP